MDKFFAALVGILILCVLALIEGVIVMWLWNWLMPELFGLHTINYLQGAGLTLLCGLLFGGSGSSGSKD